MRAAQNSPASLLAELNLLAARARTATELMAQIAEKLNASLLRYNWVGFYRIEAHPPGVPVLVRGPHAGSIATFLEIPLNRGVCGAAASSGETILLNDIADDPRYIARDLSTLAELVVPFSLRGKVTGILDVNSHFPRAFRDDDCLLCESAAHLVGSYLSEHGG
jgi:L-methionine (R)-S-oxide reductase